ncbi:MAG: alpha/beta hydrolase [Sphingobacteriaceae bacterium]|nr:alpha/beta hydrolase [Sphingobacteriaceae bacterium]
MKPFLVITLILAFTSCKKEEFNPELIKEFAISSTTNGETYNIWVSLPEGYNQSASPYSTIYVLDAKENQEIVAKNSRDISADLNVQDVVVIGIGYGGPRDADYTPTMTATGKGKSEAFLNFIKNELIPKIETDFKVGRERSNRTIIGHSYGGLFGAYAFTKQNQVFGNYLLLSPSLFYDRSVVLKYEQEQRPELITRPQLVFIGAGSNEQSLLPANDLLYQRLVKYYPLAKSKFNLINGKGHLSSKNQDIEDAITFYFNNR